MARPRIRSTSETEHDRYVRRWANPEERAAILSRNRAAKYMNRYGITIEQANEIKGNGCEVCGAKTGKLCIDHNHATGQVRGCLCVNCNSALGQLAEDYDRILKLAHYIKFKTHCLVTN